MKFVPQNIRQKIFIFEIFLYITKLLEINSDFTWHILHETWKQILFYYQTKTYPIIQLNNKVISSFIITKLKINNSIDSKLSDSCQTSTFQVLSTLNFKKLIEHFNVMCNNKLLILCYKVSLLTMLVKFSLQKIDYTYS